MTKKDYVLIAEGLKDGASYKRDKLTNKLVLEVTGEYENICRSIAIRLDRENPRFNIDKFLSACGINK
jgi:hypothetical protein